MSQDTVMYLCVFYRKPLMLVGKKMYFEDMSQKSESRDVRQIGNDAITQIHPAKDAHIHFDH